MGSGVVHVFLQWAVVVDREVSFPRLASIDAVEAPNWAVAEETAAVFFLIGAVVGMVLCGVFGDAADVAADRVGGALALFH
jgi:hypothetical protein